MIQIEEIVVKLYFYLMSYLYLIYASSEPNKMKILDKSLNYKNLYRLTEKLVYVFWYKSISLTPTLVPKHFIENVFK